MDGAPKFTYDFVMGQLRIALVAGTAYASGKGWLTPTDAGALTDVAAGLGPILVPWIASIYSNLGVVHVGSGSAAASVAKVEAVSPATAINAAAVVNSTLGKVASVLFVAILLGLFLGCNPASAQTRKPVASNGPVLTGDLIGDAKNGFKGDPASGVQLTGDPKKDALAIWTKIQAASKDDLTYASLMASAAKTPSADVRKRCWDAIIAINAQTNGEGLKNADGTPAAKPDPSAFTDIETIAEIMDSLSPQGPLFTSCSGAAELAKANVIQFISAAVTGAVGLAKLSPIPGL